MEEIIQTIGTFFAREFDAVLLDIVDIAVVATLIYFGLSLIRGTRGMQMTVGLVLVLFVHQLARRFGLITMWTILEPILTYSVLVTVIIFQSDIRRALMRVGGRPFLTGKKRGRETHEIEEVIKATRALAQRRIGALVVFQREASLDDFIEKGTQLDAVVSKELLYSIFIPSYENPMHDGATIIRDGRVEQAGAFLPLSIRAKVDQRLGARHRAAIGISEETDAVVVIVSEERGIVSLCFDGNVVQGLDGPSLREALHGLFNPQERAGESNSPEALVKPVPKTEPPVRTSMAPSSSGIVTSPADDTVEEPEVAVATAEEAPTEEEAPLAKVVVESQPPPREESTPEPADDTVVDGIQVKATRRPSPEPETDASTGQDDAPENRKSSVEVSAATEDDPVPEGGEDSDPPKETDDTAYDNVTPLASRREDKAG